MAVVVFKSARRAPGRDGGHRAEDDGYGVPRSIEADIAAEDALHVSTVGTMVHEARRQGHDFPPDKLATEPQQHDRQGLHQVPVDVSGHPHIGKPNAAARTFDYPQVQRLIGNALVSIQAFEGIAKSLRGCGDVVKHADFAQVEIRCQGKPEPVVLDSAGDPFEKVDHRHIVTLRQHSPQFGKVALAADDPQFVVSADSRQNLALNSLERGRIARG